MTEAPVFIFCGSGKNTGDETMKQLRELWKCYKIKKFESMLKFGNCEKTGPGPQIKENTIMSKKPVVLMILDGYGLNKKQEANAVSNR